MKKSIQIIFSVILSFIFLFPSAFAYALDDVPLPGDEDIEYAGQDEEASGDKIYVYVGDVDFDHNVTAADARLALRISASLYNAGADQQNAADFDRNGVVLAEDARTILRVSAKLDAPSYILIQVTPLPAGTGEEEHSSRQPEENTKSPEEDTPKNDPPVYSFDDSRVLSKAAVVYDATAGRFIYENNAHKKLEPASMTKMMTAYVAASYFKADDIIRVGNELDYVESNTSKAEIYKGQKMTFENMLYCLFLPSGCDAAYTLAVNSVRKALDRNDLSIGTEIAAFVNGMNNAAKSLGMKDSHFACPDGFPTEGHYTSAYDMTLLANALYRLPIIKRVVAAAEATVYNSDGSVFRTFTNTNDLVIPGGDHYIDYVRGIKTGWHSGIGQCLAVAAVKKTKQGERLLITVVMGCADKTDRYRTVKYLCDTAFKG
ncbi:MAG: hypothetical protein K6G90_11420 [Clostridia bacterium]|nr:hypothetical protein [Clostridia bacterium]